MSDNVTLNPGTGGPVVRSLGRTTGASSGSETQVVALDIGGANSNAESLVSPTNGLPIALPADISSIANTLNSATINAAYTLTLGNAAAVTTFAVSGLTASGATLALEYSNDGGTTWSAENQLMLASGSLGNALSADGQFRVDVAGHRQLRLRVSVVGTGTITVASNISAAPGKVSLSASLPPGTNPIGAVTKPQQQTFTATITTGNSLSGTVDLGVYRLTGIITPAALDNNTLSFAVSVDGTNFFPLYISNVERTETVATNAQHATTLAAADFYAWRYIAIRQGTNGSPVNATASRAFTLVAEG